MHITHAKYYTAAILMLEVLFIAMNNASMQNFVFICTFILVFQNGSEVCGCCFTPYIFIRAMCIQSNHICGPTVQIGKHVLGPIYNDPVWHI